MSGGSENGSTPAQPFRFKDQAAQKDGSEHGSDTRNRKRHNHHRSHRSDRPSHKRSKRDSRKSPPLSNRTPDLNPDAAFRESLFDAMGDDEGANFWEGVYGQPIHNYPNQFVNEETGELETMDDEEYAQYVRRKMWERSREGVEAAREEQRKEKARRRAQEEAEEEEEARQHTRKKRSRREDQSPHNNFLFDFEIEASLRRGQTRKDQKRWRELWSAYLRSWDDLQEFAKTRDSDVNETNLFLRNKIAWPVESGKRKDVTPQEIERFIQNGTGAIESEGETKPYVLAATLKSERVRWHPDKIQQRYGFMDIDETTMQGVTATFQVLDKMWNETRSSKD